MTKPKEGHPSSHPAGAHRASGGNEKKPEPRADHTKVEKKIEAPSHHTMLSQPPHHSTHSNLGQLTKNKEIKKLLDMGVQRGYLTYVEVNELLPLEFITA